MKVILINQIVEWDRIKLIKAIGRIRGLLCHIGIHHWSDVMSYVEYNSLLEKKCINCNKEVYHVNKNR